jgi:4-hydroxybutyryl-CoA dehydratase/vinylacetyl-CoA-Delta-isomerase
MLRGDGCAPRPPITSGAEYVESLRGRGLKVFYMGRRSPSRSITRSSARRSTRSPAPTTSPTRTPRSPPPWSARRAAVNRFLHVTESVQDVVMQNRMQRRLGQLTGTCFQRCVGMDAINALHPPPGRSTRHGTGYHARLRAFVAAMQAQNLVIGGAMTDPKGDRSKGPADQDDPDLFCRVVERRPGGVVIRGAKAHQTGCINSHWIVVMPTMRLGPRDRDYAIVCAVPVDHPGLTYVVGRQSCDTRALEGGRVDQGNPGYSGQEALILIDDVFVPDELIFMDGETEFAAELVERFTAYHRRSYVCKTGVGDVLIGAAALIADYNGVSGASHIRDKLVEMTHLNETIYGAGIASSHESRPTPSGNFQNDDLLANVCKHNVTRFPYELARLAQDLAGGLLATLPSEADFKNDEVGDLLKRLLRGRDGASAEARARVLRLIENLTLGRGAVGYLTESMHGAGSPQAQRIQIGRQMQVEDKKQLARALAGLTRDDEPA